MEDDAVSPSDPSDSSEEFTYDDEEDLSYKSDDDDNDDDEQSTVRSAPPNEDRKSQNVIALLRGNIVVKRQSLLPRVYSVTETAANVRKPFKPPSSNGYIDKNEQLVRRLWARKRFVPWGSTRPALVPITNRLHVPVEEEPSKEIVDLPQGFEPLVLWQPEDFEEGDCNAVSIAVEPLLVNFLRPHQREGVQFMFECVSGLCSGANIHGCILADDMGLGKTLQSITLLYTLLRQGFDGKPMVKKAIVVTPTSLVSNWEAEIKKWVGERLKLVALCESTRDDVVSGIDSFISPHSFLQVLIVSYETFRMHSSKFSQSGSCDLLICDEAHRLKNDQTLTNRALAAVSCKRRILLSGTPMQNDLEEFYAMVNFTNPGILGDAANFRRHYETPIICGREPTATAEEKKLGAERSAELSAKVNQVKQAITEETKKSKILAYITALKKLCNHPKLIYDTIRSGNPGTSAFEDCLHIFPPEMFSGRSGSRTGGDGLWVELSGKMHVLARLLAQLRQRTDDRIVLVSNYTQGLHGSCQLFMVSAVIHQTLDLFAQLCRERRYPFLRLDGTTSISKRQKLVNHFNDPSKDEFVFLLSSKAGGCGLNLIGGNRLVLFDPDWNPANDKQAAARVWRDGQKKRVYIYRFLSTGTIEEKVYQRQMSKEGLQKVIQQEQTDSKTQGNFLSTEDLRDLFTFHDTIRSEIHEKMSCNRCQNYEVMLDDRFENIDEVGEIKSTNEDCQADQEDIGGFASMAGCLHKLKSSEKQVGTPKEEDLGNWGHHFSPHQYLMLFFKLQPEMRCAEKLKISSEAGFFSFSLSGRMSIKIQSQVSFAFTNQVDGKLVPVESKVRPMVELVEGNKNQTTSKENLTRKFMLPSQRQPSLPTISSHGISIGGPFPASFKHLQRPLTKVTEGKTYVALKPALSKTHVALKPKLSLANQLPQKRLSPDCVSDDDFQ
ncbi:unnamed protein product [Ilex paraguariensis]|uniref:DNA repair and recombination protein RAD54 n=1 Tax=Ilex paraguariensis TaxID=185542 RepID=A0ABC8RG39_9AQUA